MEREALAMLEKRVAAMRVIVAEKAVLARSLSHDETDAIARRWNGELSTALLAIAVFAVFMLGREAGILAARGEPCAGVSRGEYAFLSLVSDDYDVTMDTMGNLWRKKRWERRVPVSAVREIVDRLARGCYFEAPPPLPSRMGVATSTISLHVGNRYAQQSYVHGAGVPLCGGHEDLRLIEQSIRDLADH